MFLLSYISYICSVLFINAVVCLSLDSTGYMGSEAGAELIKISV